MASSVPTLRFLFSHPAHFVALGFGSGLAPVAPGTFGTLVAIPLAGALRNRFDDLGYAVAVVLFFVLGIGVSAVTARDLGVADHGAIVWDEVVAFLVVLFFVGDSLPWIALAFVLFRGFDIVKPPPIRAIDAALKSGFGVMVDDLLAAGYTLLVLALARRVLG
ncbi:MAG: phosphatidylglycerophosphatase A [Betaproteobacteria bacterium]|nr:phosphatidylglycerophosphatase A [Betaproteobacteria bacterium]